MATQLSTTNHSRDSAGLTYVYPVISRRAGGVSIGINLNPNNACNWRCVYCQVPNLTRGAAPLIDLVLLKQELSGFLDDVLSGRFLEERVETTSHRIVDVALSGNGEPTSAKEFPLVIKLIGTMLEQRGLADTVKLRVITNGSLIARDYVQEGLSILGEMAGEVWFKLDAGTSAGFSRINNVELTSQSVIQNLVRSAALCSTWVQTCLFAVNGVEPNEDAIDSYLALLSEVMTQDLKRGVKGVLLYGLARPSLQPEASQLSNLHTGRLEEIAERIRALGLEVKVSH